MIRIAYVPESQCWTLTWGYRWIGCHSAQEALDEALAWMAGRGPVQVEVERKEEEKDEQ
jgi:hypothetical protein